MRVLFGHDMCGVLSVCMCHACAGRHAHCHAPFDACLPAPCVRIERVCDAMRAQGVTLIATLHPREAALEVAGHGNRAAWGEAVRDMRARISAAVQAQRQQVRGSAHECVQMLMQAELLQAHAHADTCSDRHMLMQAHALVGTHASDAAPLVIPAVLTSSQSPTCLPCGSAKFHPSHPCPDAAVPAGQGAAAGAAAAAPSCSPPSCLHRFFKPSKALPGWRCCARRPRSSSARASTRTGRGTGTTALPWSTCAWA